MLQMIKSIERCLCWLFSAERGKGKTSNTFNLNLGIEEPCSKLQGIFDCKEFCLFFDSLAFPAATRLSSSKSSCGECTRCAVQEKIKSKKT